MKVDVIRIGDKYLNVGSVILNREVPRALDKGASPFDGIVDAVMVWKGRIC